MELWKDTGNGDGWFAVLIGEQIVMIPHFTVKALRAAQSHMNEFELREYGTPLEKWLKKK